VRNLNINQFALPGMEHLAHPGARHLAAGTMFHLATEKQLEDTPWAGPHHRHTLYAHNMGAQFDPDRHHGNAQGWMEWAGQHDPPHMSKYPGEIQMVERGYGMERPTKGLMSDMYRMGHQMNMGQSTVPLHSPTRTPEGEAWSAKIGGPRPPMNDHDWRPPKGLHPYEKQQAQVTRRANIERAKTKRSRPGQGTLF